MREYLFHGKCRDSDKWVEGILIHRGNYCCILQDEEKLHPIDDPYMSAEFGIIDGHATPVVPESVGQYTDMNEFVVSDRSYNKPLFEGDIVEVWGTRTPKYMNPQSQYDGDVKVRAVIHFKNGKWSLDYNNEYNKVICKLRGSEQTERTVDTWDDLHHFQCHSNDEEWYREHNHRFKWHDIVKIGNVFENADLLEG